MLAVSALRSTVKDEHLRGEMETTSAFAMCTGDDNGFPDFTDANALLDSIDFDDLFVGMDDGDVLPDLEMDPELLAEFSVSGGEESSDMNSSPSAEKAEEGNSLGSGPGLDSSSNTGGEEIVSKNDESAIVAAVNNNINNNNNNNNNNNPSPKEGHEKSRKSSSSQSKNSHGKRKVKVDWTPELHRRFVQAVEQLGVDKAVPSRILELMGIDCLTRHNIASHLQKYRSHRKHLLAREAEAASWTQRRQMYGSAVAGGGGKRPDMNPWLAPPPPTMGFPPMTPPPPMHHFRPLHVWGHPSMDQSAVHMWPKHLTHSPSPPPQPPVPPTWGPPAPPPDSPFWHPNHQRVPNAPTPGTPCFPQPLPPTRFAAPPVPGIPPHAMYKVEPGLGVTPTGQSHPPRPLFDSQPSKESIDAAIGDVLSKPWLPLPLGLKPPSTDSVMVELVRQGVPKIPPATCS